MGDIISHAFLGHDAFVKSLKATLSPSLRQEQVELKIVCDEQFREPLGFTKDI